MQPPPANSTIHTRQLELCGPRVDLTSAACPCAGRLTRNAASSPTYCECLSLLACFIVIVTLPELTDLVAYVSIRMDRNGSLSTYIAPTHPQDTYIQLLLSPIKTDRLPFPEINSFLSSSFNIELMIRSWKRQSILRLDSKSFILTSPLQHRSKL